MTEKRTILQPGLLADKLVGVVDNVRRKIHSALGTRPWKVEIITRRWSGEERGVGTPTTTILELDPVPMVRRNTRDRFGPAGKEADGSIVLTGVSLRYTEAELQPKVDARTEVSYRISDLHGTQSKPRFYVLTGAPTARRGDKEGDATDWIMYLNETSALSGLDGVNRP